MTTPTQEVIRDTIAGNPDLQKLIDDAVATTEIADTIPDNISSGSCPNLNTKAVEDFNESANAVMADAAKVIAGGRGKKGGMRVQRGGPSRRRKPASAPAGLEGQLPSEEEDESTGAESGAEVNPNDAIASGVRGALNIRGDIVAARKKALKRITELTDEKIQQGEIVQAQQEQIMALLMDENAGFDSEEEREEFFRKALETRKAMKKALSEPGKRYFWVLAAMCNICAAIAIGYSGAPQGLANNFGETFRGLLSADSLNQSCDGDSMWNLFYFGDCVEVTTNAEALWATIFAVAGALAAATGYVLITDTTNPFLVLVALGSRSVDSLAMFFENMGGVTNVIKWPFQKITGVCRYMVGAISGTPATVAAPAGQQVPAPQPLPLSRSQSGPGGRKRRRTIKRRGRKTKARKGKKGRKTKARKGKKRATRKRQRGGTCGKTSHQSTPMLDLYQAGGKKRKAKGRKTHRKPKRRHGKKHGTRRR